MNFKVGLFSNASLFWVTSGGDHRDRATNSRHRQAQALAVSQEEHFAAPRALGLKRLD